MIEHRPGSAKSHLTGGRVCARMHPALTPSLAHPLPATRVPAPTQLQNASNVWRPTQEGSSLLIRGFPSGPKPYEEVLTHLRKVRATRSTLAAHTPRDQLQKPDAQPVLVTRALQGSILEKYGRHGKPKFHHFKLGADDSELQWVSKGVSENSYTAATAAI